MARRQAVRQGFEQSDCRQRPHQQLPLAADAEHARPPCHDVTLNPVKSRGHMASTRVSETAYQCPVAAVFPIAPVQSGRRMATIRRDAKQGKCNQQQQIDADYVSKDSRSAA